MSRAVSHAFLLSALLLLLTNCRGEEDSQPAVFPIKLLPSATPVDYELFIEPDFGAPDALDPWFVLEMSESGEPTTTTPAADHPCVSVDQGALVLQPGRGVLFRYVEVPSESTVVVRARLPSISGPDESICPLLRAPLMAEFDGDFVAYSLPELEAAIQDHKARELYFRFARRILKFSTGPTGFWWGDDVADGEMRVAEARFKTRNHSELRALCVRLPDEPTRIESIWFGEAPVLGSDDKNAYDSVSPSNEEDLRPTVASFAGELRPAIRVDAGTHVVLARDLSPDATKLSFGVVTPPQEAGSPEEAHWVMELVRTRATDGTEGVGARSNATPSSADVLQLGEGTLSSGKLPVRWRDVVLSWPGEDVFPDAQLHFRVKSGAPVLLSQPIVHGPNAGDRPNLLLISIDTLRPDHVGWHGYERPTTPVLDELASGATVFEQCASVGPYTLPSHATMLSGLFPARHGARETTDRLGEDVPTLATLLSSRGWATAAFTGGGFLSPDFGFSNGFDRYQSVDPVHDSRERSSRGRYSGSNRMFQDQLDELHSLNAVEGWIKSHADGPWFAFVHTYVAHEYRPPTQDFALFDTKPGSDWGADVQERLVPRAWIESAPEVADLEHLTNLYDASIHFVDREIGGLIDRLDKAGQLENTVVVLTSDHGEEFLEHGHLRHSQSLYEEMLHVPLVIRMPGQDVGHRVSVPVHLADLTPTVLEAMQLPAIPGLDGASLRGLLWEGGEGPESSGRRDDSRTEMYATVETNWSRRASLRVGDIKLIRGDTDEALTYPSSAPWELFDLASDPGETNNLFEQRAHAAGLLQQRLLDLEKTQAASAAPSSRAEVREELKEQLKALGYVDGG
ncbi:MAG: sulfatase [Planctomycetota bacterium]|nr:sulfatase [Planctomycetota bacterium]